MCGGASVIVEDSVVDMFLELYTLRIEPIIDIMFGRDLHIDSVRLAIMLTVEATEIGGQDLIAMVNGSVVCRELPLVCEVIQHVEICPLYRINTAWLHMSIALRYITDEKVETRKARTLHHSQVGVQLPPRHEYAEGQQEFERVWRRGMIRYARDSRPDDILRSFHHPSICRLHLRGQGSLCNRMLPAEKRRHVPNLR